MRNWNVFCRPVSGGSTNPARSLGPAIISGPFGRIWVYVLAPTAGAVAGAFLYKILNNNLPRVSAAVANAAWRYLKIKIGVHNLFYFHWNQCKIIQSARLEKSSNSLPTCLWEQVFMEPNFSGLSLLDGRIEYSTCILTYYLMEYSRVIYLLFIKD